MNASEYCSCGAHASFLCVWYGSHALTRFTVICTVFATAAIYFLGVKHDGTGRTLCTGIARGEPPPDLCFPFRNLGC